MLENHTQVEEINIEQILEIYVNKYNRYFGGKRTYVKKIHNVINLRIMSNARMT